ncbi:unnamed protein product [Camellia sinensis]
MEPPKKSLNLVHKFYRLNEIKIATRNFSQENLIGEGSFGTVYKGTFGNETVAAIKVFKMEQHKAFNSFIAECEALRNIRHRNLIRVISVCSSSDFKALVLHFMPNGSLEQWLHERNKRLCIKERLEIVQDVASAIEYLHHDCESPVMHCDLKPSSVFLDESMCAHVADFRLAQILVNAANKGSVSSTLGLKGSIGYIPPGMNMELVNGVSTKGDVYSFGILILEIFTKKKPTDEMFTGEMDLQRWVSMELPNQVMDIMDRGLLGNELKSKSFDLCRWSTRNWIDVRKKIT